MEVRYITPEDRETLESWFTAHGWEMLPDESLPPTGYMIEGHCAVWLYHSATNIAWMEWLVGNPTVNKKQLWKCINHLVKVVLEKSNEAGMPIVFTSVKHEGLIRAYENCGFKKTDTNMTNMIFGGA